MLVMGGGKDTSTAMSWSVEPIYNDMTQSQRMLMEIFDAGHASFSNACELLPTYPGCDSDTLSNEEAHPLINQAVLQYLGSLLGYEFEQALPFEDSRVAWRVTP